MATCAINLESGFLIGIRIFQGFINGVRVSKMPLSLGFEAEILLRVQVRCKQWKVLLMEYFPYYWQKTDTKP